VRTAAERLLEAEALDREEVRALGARPEGARLTLWEEAAAV
jgi:hypothetical protein